MSETLRIEIDPGNPPNLNAPPPPPPVAGRELPPPPRAAQTGTTGALEDDARRRQQAEADRMSEIRRANSSRQQIEAEYRLRQQREAELSQKIKETRERLASEGLGKIERDMMEAMLAAMVEAQQIAARELQDDAARLRSPSPAQQPVAPPRAASTPAPMSPVERIGRHEIESIVQKMGGDLVKGGDEIRKKILEAHKAGAEIFIHAEGKTRPVTVDGDRLRDPNKNSIGPVAPMLATTPTEPAYWEIRHRQPKPEASPVTPTAGRVQIPAPEVETPTIPTIKVPSPEITVPAAGKVQMPAPEVTTPTVPPVNIAAPSVNVPTVPPVEIPAPKIIPPALQPVQAPSAATMPAPKIEAPQAGAVKPPIPEPTTPKRGQVPGAAFEPPQVPAAAKNVLPMQPVVEKVRQELAPRAGQATTPTATATTTRIPAVGVEAPRAGQDPATAPPKNTLNLQPVMEKAREELAPRVGKEAATAPRPTIGGTGLERVITEGVKHQATTAEWTAKLAQAGLQAGSIFVHDTGTHQRLDRLAPTAGTGAPPAQNPISPPTQPSPASPTKRPEADSKSELRQLFSTTAMLLDKTLSSASRLAPTSGSNDGAERALGVLEDVSGKAAAGLLLVNPAAAAAAGAFSMATGAVKSFMEGADKTAKRLAPYSAEITLAQAKSQWDRTLKDIDRARSMGPEIAKFVEQKAQASEKWDDLIMKIQLKLMPHITKLIEFIAAGVEKLDRLEEIRQDIMDDLDQTSNSMREWANRTFGTNLEMLEITKRVEKNTRKDTSSGVTFQGMIDDMLGSGKRTEEDNLKPGVFGGNTLKMPIMEGL